MGDEREWTLHVCDKGHVEHHSLEGVCWACFPGGKRTWEPDRPKQTEPNQTKVVVVPLSRAEAAEAKVAEYEAPLPTNFAAPGTPENTGYELRQRINKAMRWLREAEDYARLAMPAWPTADRIRAVHEKLTGDVLNGKTTVPSVEEAAERDNRRLREALEVARPWMDTYEDNMGLPDFEAREKAIEQVEKALASSGGATREEQT